MRSCATPVDTVGSKRITTLSAIGNAEKPHKVQAAFIEEDAFQCGYCTPGQILSAVALLAEGVADSDGAIREGMSGNICRCGAYPNICAAVRRLRGRG